jgi:hypothetical protein
MTQLPHPTESIWEHQHVNCHGDLIGRPYHKAGTRNEVIFVCASCGALDYVDRCGICDSTVIDRYWRSPR